MTKAKIKTFISKTKVALFYLYLFFGTFLVFDYTGLPFSLNYYLYNWSFVSLSLFILTFMVDFFVNKGWKDVRIEHRVFIIIVVFVSLTSFIMALGQFWKFIDIQETNTIVVSIKATIHFFFISIGILAAFLTAKEIKEKTFFVVFIVSLSFHIFLGLLQVLIVFNNNISIHIYSFFSLLRMSLPFNYFVQTGRIALGTPEPSFVAGLSFCYFIPTLILLLFKEKSTVKRIMVISLMMILFILSIFTKSAENYLAIAFFLLFFLVCIIVYFAKNKRFFSLLLLCGLAVGVFAFFFSIQDLRDVVVSKLSFSENNWSGGKRLSTIINCLCCFCSSPLFGIGAGMAGYYYFDNVVDTWMVASRETRDLMLGIKRLETGGPFLPYFLSGYGLIGTVLFVFAIVYLVKKTFKTMDIRTKLVFAFSFSCFLFLSSISINFLLAYYLPIIFASLIIYKNNKVYYSYESVCI